MRVAVCRYPLQTIESCDAFADKQARLLAQARCAGADLAVLPEYLALELAGMQPAAVREDLAASLAQLQSLHSRWIELFGRLAQDLGMAILAGTYLLRESEGRYRNRAYLFGRKGRHVWQDKLQLTAFERECGLIASGDALKVFDAGPIRLAVAVCYDVEFPVPVRLQREAGARLLLVPSCTDTRAGANRVRTSCLARALENRQYVACSVTAGGLPWSPALDTNTGYAAVCAPMDNDLPEDGILSVTRDDEPWAIADLDFHALTDGRPTQVAIDRDWSQQSWQATMLEPLEI